MTEALHKYELTPLEYQTVLHEALGSSLRLMLKYERERKPRRKPKV